MDNYIINKETLAILPCGEKMSLVYEGEKMIIVNAKTNNIIKRNCMRYGSTFDGRLKSAEKITGTSYKTPILVSGSNKLIFFPTSSPRLSSVAWINMMNVDKTYYNVLKKVSVIVFNNNTLVEFNVSLNIINNQLLKSMQLEHYLKKKRIYRA